MSLSPGARLGPYEVLGLLGAGGMGEVWRAKDTRVDRMVALKVLPEEFFDDDERRARFEREARTLASLNHPGIAILYSFEEIPGPSSSSSRHLLVMELVEGESLSARMKAGTIPMGDALAIARDIAGALEAAHAKGIVHRDLKPGNVMISKDGRVKLLDFGLAKASGERVATEDLSHSPTMTDAGTTRGVILGTAAYMSPEQARGERVDARTDVWAFGVVLWELLTGKRLFRGQSTPDTLAAVLREPVDFKALPLSTPRAVRDLLSRCLERDSGKRLASIGDARRALETAKEGSGISRLVVLRLAATLGVLIALAAGAVFLSRRTAATRNAKAALEPSIAVLPFRNLSEDKSEEYFSDGLTEELTSLLTRVKALHVAGHASSLAFKGKAADLGSIGQKLHVATVLEGSVRRSGDRLRVSTELVNVADGYQIWSETYDRKLTEVFSVQEQIAGAVVAELRVKLLPEDRPAASQHRTSNTEAYNQYLLGLQFFNRQNLDGYRRSVAAFEKAVALDPNYATAYAGLARSLIQVVDFSENPAQQAENQKRARESAEKAVTLDPALAEAYSARASVRTYIERDWAGAQADFKRSFELNPSDARALSQYARLLARLGRLPEAIVAGRKATELDPLLALSWNILGAYLYSDGQFAEARKALARALEVSPENEHARFFLGITALLDGKPQDALSAPEPANYALRMALRAMAEHDLGHAAESRKALEELIAKHGQTFPYRVAQVYAWRGEKDPSFEWLDRALAQHDTQIATVKIDPLVAKLRDDPRYVAVLKRMNLPI